MHDIKKIRDNPNFLKKGLILRGEIDWQNPIIVDLCHKLGVEAAYKKETILKLLENIGEIPIEKITYLEKLDKERRDFIFQVEQLKAERNKASMEIASKKKANEPVDDILTKMKEVSDKIKLLDEKVAEIDKQIDDFLLTIPNVPHDTTPVGTSSDDNLEIRCFGTPPKFEFKPKDHVDLGANLGILDMERAGKIAGARFSLLVGQGALLERALINFMLDLHIKKHGYTEVFPPLMVNSASMRGTGQLPKFEDDLFKVRNTDYYLIPTAEVPVTNIYAGEIIPESKLPIKLTAYTPCFRSEAGSYGKDTRGLIRQHQFNKVELVKFTHPDRSYDELESLLIDAEEVLKQLEIPYRVVTLCSGDLGFSAAKTYDIEIWIPSQGKYREVSSCSNFEDFQARRANIKFKGEGKGAKAAFVHTLNGSGVAVGRVWLAILENFQDEGGRVFIPKALQPYMSGITHLERMP